MLLLVFTAQAQKTSNVNQLSDDQVLEFYRRAQASGMSEMQIEQAALARGYTLSDIARMRQRIADLKNKKKQSETESDNEADTVLTTGRKQIGKLSQRELLERNRQIEDSLKNKRKKLEIFGSKLFQNADITFEPNLRIATPKNYQLGPDDELVVDIFGNASGSHKLTVSPEGTVKLLNLAPIFVSGLTIDEAKEKIVSRLRQAYSGLNAGGGSYATVNLGNIRSINVTVIGEATKPGTYTVSSLATVFNALYLCGGPDSTGSYRNIRILRNNKVVRTLDLYKFLLDGEQTDNILLQDQDIIHIPFYTTRIELDGEVKRPAVYESKAGEPLEQLLNLAGGFSGFAYKAYVTLRRTTDKEIQVFNISQNDFKNFVPQNGDRYEVGKILDRYANRVQIQGAVFRPGDYALTSDVRTLSQVVALADGVKENAFIKRIMIHRLKPNLEPEIVSVDLEKILKGTAEDIQLKRQDSIVVKSVSELHKEYFISIFGQINVPDNKYPYSENLTVSDLIVQAGGFAEGGIPERIEIARRVNRSNLEDVPENYNIQIISLAIDSLLGLSPADAQFKLKPFDIVYVRKSPRYEIQKNVAITGEVNYSGTYAIANNTERISSIIDRAGGIKPSAYLEGAHLLRQGEKVAIDIQKIIEDPTIEGNLTLVDGDSLFIPKRSELVRIYGAVLNPSIVNYSKSFRYKDYLSQAGGYEERAIKSKVYVSSANGYTQRTRHFLFFKIYPKISPGATIYVPTKPIDNTKSDITGPVLLSFTSTLIIALVTLLR
ncbi:MAG: SLBB domain-containing protein [Spirosomataceae bacterium]